MKTRTLLAALIKVLGLYLFVISFQSLSPLLTIVLTYLSGLKPHFDIGLLYPSVSFLINFLFGLVLILHGQKIASFITRTEDGHSEELTINLDGLEKALVSLLGLYLSIKSILHIVHITSKFYLTKNQVSSHPIEMQIVDQAALVNLSLQFVIGLVLIIMSVQINRLLSFLRYNQSQIDS